MRWVLQHYECPACKHAQRPPARLPAEAPKTFGLNIFVGADIFEMVHPFSQQGELWLHVIDWGTGFQQSERLLSKQSAHVYATYSRIWVRFFGHPATLVVDGGGEFSSIFALAAGQHGTLIHVIDPYTPWLTETLRLLAQSTFSLTE